MENSERDGNTRPPDRPLEKPASLPGGLVQLYISGSCRYSESLVSTSFPKQKALLLFLYCVLYSCTHDPSGSELLDTSGCFQNQCTVDPSGYLIPVHYFLYTILSPKMLFCFGVWLYFLLHFLSIYDFTLVCVENGTRKDDVARQSSKYELTMAS